MKSSSIKFLSKRKILKGYIALLSVIAVSALGLAVMMSVILSGVNAAKTDIATQQGGNARLMSSSCGEEALQKILETGTTSSSGGLTISGNTCSYTISSQNGQNIKVDSTGTAGSIISKIEIIIATTTPSIVLSSWKEVKDF